MEHSTCRARSSRVRSVWLRVVLALGLLLGMGNAAAQCALSGTVGTPYSQGFSVSGGSAPYTWNISAGALPAGLALTYSGASALISGTATAGGNFSFTLRVSHSGGSGTLACTLAMSPPAIAIAPTTLPDADWNVAYSQSLAASAGTAPYTYSVSAGALPPGMSLALDGTLSGTPSATGTFNFTARAQDSSTGTGPYAGTRAYTLVVAPPTITLSPASLPAATVAASYDQAISASGGTGPYFYTVTAGALPPGVSLSGGGNLAGTPTAGGSFSFGITATDINGFTGTQAYTLDVDPPTLSLAPSTLPNAVAGSAYSQSIAASGGVEPYDYALSAGALPAGLSLSATGILSGTTTTAGSFSFTVTATDSGTGTGPYTVSQAYTLAVDAPTITIAPPVLPPGTAGSAYSQALTASGGVGPHDYSLVAGALPVGVSFSSAGLLSGTPTVAGDFGFTVRATDDNGFSGDQAYTLSIAAPVIAVTPPTLPAGVAGTAYSQALDASGGVGPYGYSLVSGALPVGVSFSSAGVFSGTPTVAGDFSLTVRATDDNGFSGDQAYTLSIAAPVIAVTPPTLPAGVAGAAYSQALDASGGVGPYGYSLVSGALPVGVSFSSAGVFSGTPTVAGDFNFTVRATDDNGFSGDRVYTLTVAAPVVTVSPSTLPAGVAGTAYSQALSASGGVAPYGYSLLSGALPAGLAFSSAGVLSGTPVMAGDFAFTVRATDDNGFSADQAYTLTIAAPAIAIAPSTLPAGMAGTAYAQALDASGGVAPYGYSLVGGALPAGLSLSSAGALSGTPTVAGDFGFTVRATDANGFAGDQAYTLAIAAPTIAVTPSTVPTGTAGTAYSQAFSASGGVEPYAWSLASGDLPAGLALSAGGMLSGTPTVAGSFDFTVRATDANGFTGEQAYTLAITAPAIALTPTTLPSGTAGTAYSQAFDADGGVAPYSYSLAGGALPAGLSLSSGGALSGTPTVAGSFDFTVRATDANGFAGEQAYTLAIAAPTIAVAPTTLPAGTAGTAYSQALSASGGVGPYAYSLAAGELPVGIALSPAGAVAGTPTAVGSFEFTVRATDANGFTGEQAYTLEIAALVPVANADSAHTAAVQPVTIDVTANDTGGPFTAATVLSVSPVDAGTATIAQSGDAWLLTFVPAADFSGTATVRYTVSNAYATSAAATLEVLVDARPDPSRDPDVLGLLSAQAESIRGFARAQILNVQQRLESLHGGANGNGWHNRLSPASATRCDPALETCPAMHEDEVATTTAPAQPSNAPFGLWTAGAFGSGERDMHFGRSALEFETRGVSVGADYRLSDRFVLGAALGYGRDRTHVGMHATRADGDSWTAMTYASWSPSAATFVDAVFGYQQLSFDTRRTVAANGATVFGSRDGTQWFGSLATGYEYRNDGIVIAPYGRVDVARAELDGYAEQGDPVHALRYGRQDVDTGTASLGLRLERRFQQEWGVFTPLFRLEHQHDFQGQGSATLQYADLPSGPFYRAYGDTFDRSRWLLGLGTAFQLSETLGLKLEYQFVGDDTMDDQTLRLILQGGF